VDLKVLFLSIYDPYEHVYGAGNHLRNLSESLKNLGCEVHVLVPGAKTRSSSKNGIYFHYLKSSPFRSIGEGIAFSLSSFRSVNEICDNYKIDVVHSQSPSGFGYALFQKKNRPFVVTLHGTSFGEIESYLNVPLSNVSINILRDAAVTQPLWALLTSIEYKKATKVIAVSNYLAKEADKYYHLPKGKVISIYNGVNLPDPKTSPTADAARVPNVLFVGRLVWRKGAQYLVDAAPQILSKYPDAKIRIVGLGEQKASLEKRVENLKITHAVEFLGKVSASQLRELYSQTDVFVQPSLYEPFGITILEAMSFSKPVIASCVGGIPEIINQGVDGLLVEPGNVLQLGGSILSLFSDSSIRRKYGRNAYEKVRTEFTWAKVARRTLKLYEDLLMNS